MMDLWRLSAAEMAALVRSRKVSAREAATSALARLEAACAQTMRHAEVVAGMQRVAQPILYRNRAEFAAFSASESEKFRALIEAAGLRAAE